MSGTESLRRKILALRNAATAIERQSDEAEPEAAAIIALADGMLADLAAIEAQAGQWAALFDPAAFVRSGLTLNSAADGPAEILPTSLLFTGTVH